MKLSTLSAALFLLLLASCTKNYDTPSSTSHTAIGNGSNTYMPISNGNVWTYYPSWTSTITKQESSYILNDNGTVATIATDSTGECVLKFGGNPFACVGVSNIGLINPKPFIYIPAAPAVGQTWTDSVATGIALTAKVISTTASAASFQYGYTNCLQISYQYTYSVGANTGSVTIVKYFSKGVGVVYLTSTINDYQTVTHSMQSFLVN